MRKAFRPSPAEWLDMLRAEWYLVVAQGTAWMRPRGALMGSSAQPKAEARSAERGEIDRWALAVDRAASYGPLRPKCLVRAMALQRLLSARGIRGSEVQIGVRWRGGRFAAHAWVVYRGEVVSDHEWHVNTFQNIARMNEESTV